MARQLPGSAIQANTITTTQLVSSVVTQIQSGGGPKISSITYANSATAASTAGGETIIIRGSGFDANVQVYIANTIAPSTTYSNTSYITFTTPAKGVGLYTLSIINGDGGSAVYPVFNFSSKPNWVTTSPLPSFNSTANLNVQLSATSDSNVSYSLAQGSTLPSGVTLSSSGLISGAITTPPVVNTTYNFTVQATDLENQTTSQAFSMTAVAYDFTISPAVNNVSSWLFSANGNLVITNPGEYTLTFAATSNKVVKMWGAGGAASNGGSTSWGQGGAGGAAVGTVAFGIGNTYIIRVGSAGGNATGSKPALAYGAGNAGGLYSVGYAGSGGGYTGVFLSSVTQANAVLMAGGGGGGGSNRGDGLGGRRGAAGGGTAGENANAIDGLISGSGTQSAGGSGTASNGSALTGGNGSGGGGGGGGGYYGGGGGAAHGDGGYGGGGGSGYYSPSYVTSATLYAGSSTTAGNNSDASKPSGAGAGSTAGSLSGNGAVVIIA